MTLAGALVTCRQTGTILYVVDRRADDGIRWRLHAKRVDASGRSESLGALPAPAISSKSAPHPPTHCKEHDAMMSDKAFAELELRATICPGQCEWPKPEYIHWQKLHEAANEARERVKKVYMQMDEIDRNGDLSPDGKYRYRSKTAAQAIADFEVSKTLERARQAVELAVAKHKFEQDVSPEIAQDREAALKAMKELERAWQRAMDKIAERASLTKCAAISPSRQSGTGCRQVITLRVEGNRLRERAGSSTRNDRDGVKNRVSLPRHPEQSELLWRFFTAG